MKGKPSRSKKSNSKLNQVLLKREAELAVINSVQMGLASKLDMQGIYELVGENIRETFNAQVVSIATYDRAAQLLQGRYYFEGGMALPGITLPAFGFRKQVVESCKPIIINEDMPRWMEKYNNPVIQGSQPKSAIFIPMIVGDEATGVISLQNNDQENAFTETDLRLLTTLANSMSVALENARLFSETQRLLKETEQRAAELQIINTVQQGLASQLEVQAIYDLVGDEIRDIFNAQVVMISTYDGQTETIEHRYAIERGERVYPPGPHPIKGFRTQIVQTRQPVLVNTNVGEIAARLGQPTLPGTITPKSWLGCQCSWAIG